MEKVKIEYQEPILKLPTSPQGLTGDSWLRYAKAVLKSSRRELNECGLPEKLWDHDGRFAGLRATPDKVPRTVIAVVGKTGAGKSSLLNAILDVAVLPKGSTMSCTAIPTKIKYHGENVFRAKIKVMKPSEWKEEIESARRLLQYNDTEGKPVDEHSLKQKAIKSALDRVRTIYSKYLPSCTFEVQR
jgi:AAA15 family ATPase/GTPase